LKGKDSTTTACEHLGPKLLLTA